MKFTLKVLSGNLFPINYNYPLSAILYKLLKFGSNDFAEFLHNIGFKQDGKTYKLFTFGLKFNDKVKANKTHLILSGDQISLLVSSPLVDSFLKSLIVGSFVNEKIQLISGGTNVLLQIEQIEMLPTPNFSKETKFYPISPLVIGTKKEVDGETKPYYFRYYDNINEIERVFNNNLINKYELVTHSKYVGENLVFSWDTDYINDRLKRNKRVTKLINNKIHGNEINIKANEIPFSLIGNTDLMKIGYECGFGSQNSLGFGLTEIREEREQILEDR